MLSKNSKLKRLALAVGYIAGYVMMRQLDDPLFTFSPDPASNQEQRLEYSPDLPIWVTCSDYPRGGDTTLPYIDCLTFQSLEALAYEFHHICDHILAGEDIDSSLTQRLYRIADKRDLIVAMHCTLDPSGDINRFYPPDLPSEREFRFETPLEWRCVTPTNEQAFNPHNPRGADYCHDVFFHLTGCSNPQEIREMDRRYAQYFCDPNILERMRNDLPSCIPPFEGARFRLKYDGSSGMRDGTSPWRTINNMVLQFDGIHCLSR